MLSCSLLLFLQKKLKLFLRYFSHIKLRCHAGATLPLNMTKSQAIVPGRE